MNFRKFAFLFTTATIMIGWQIYVQFFASVLVLRLIAHYGLDKIIHLVGGAFLLVCADVFRIRRIVPFALFILAAATIWEITEFSFNADVATFFEKERELWIRDTIGDYLAAFLGAAITWFVMRASAKPRPPVPRPL